MQRNEYRNVMFISPDDVKVIGLVNYNVQDDTIGFAIRTSQEVYLQEIIGTLLYHRLQELVYNAIVGAEDNIDGFENTEYAVLLEEFIEPYLTAKTAVEVLMPLTFKIRNIGLSKDSDENIDAAYMDDLKEVINYYSTHVAEYAKRLSKYLCENKELFVELTDGCNCGGNDALLGYKFVNTPLYLGLKNKCCK